MKNIILKSITALLIVIALIFSKSKEVYAEAEEWYGSLIYCQCNNGEDGQKYGCITTETEVDCLLWQGTWWHPDELEGNQCYEYGHHGQYVFLCAPEQPEP